MTGEWMTSFLGRSTIVASAAAVLLLPFTANAQADSYTDLPELQAATVVSTRTAASASAAHPAGTTITYRFVESLAHTRPDPASFLLYDADGTAVHADRVHVSRANVTALFKGLDTHRKAAAEVLAATTDGAVVDPAGQASAIGAVPITWRLLRIRGRACPVCPGLVETIEYGWFVPSR
jgi:hypothetical protein